MHDLSVALGKMSALGFNFVNRIVWSSVSNAFDKSRNVLMGNWLLSNRAVILSTISRAANSVEWWGLQPD